jgi:hypothetical protein
MSIPMGGGARTANGSGGGTFVLCPAGPQQMVCCDVIDHGVVMAPGFGGRPPQPKHKITIRWESQHKMSDGRPFIVQRRFTLSAHPKAALRQYLESWRGRKFSDEEAGTFDVEKLIGVNAICQVTHVQKSRGVFAEVVSIMPPMAGMARLTVSSGYIRVKDRTPEEQQRERSAPEDAEPDGEYRPAPGPAAAPPPPEPETPF